MASHKTVVCRVREFLKLLCAFGGVKGDTKHHGHSHMSMQLSISFVMVVPFRFAQELCQIWVQSVHLTTHFVPCDDTPQGQRLRLGPALAVFDISESVDSDDSDIGVLVMGLGWGSLLLLGREARGDWIFGEFLEPEVLLRFNTVGLGGGVFAALVGDPSDPCELFVPVRGDARCTLGFIGASLVM